MDKTSLGDRMKRYEASAETRLVRRLPVIVRIDGKRFSKYTKRLGVQKPFDPAFLEAMKGTALALVRNVTGCVLGYTQSDEISLVLRNDQSLESEPFLDNRVQKIVSILASMATGWFNRVLASTTCGGLRQRFPADWEDLDPAFFDARAYVVPGVEEAKNYLVWRQQDCTRNSILNAAYYGIAALPDKGKKTARKMMHGLNTKELQELMFSEARINWNDLDPEFKRGTAVHRVLRTVETPDGTAVRSKWIAGECPVFQSPDGKKWLDEKLRPEVLPPDPEKNGD
jgi:tRNA(His) guanylyltransferase